MTFGIDHASSIVFCVPLLDIEKHVHIGFVASAVPGTAVTSVSGGVTGLTALPGPGMDVSGLGMQTLVVSGDEGVSGGGLTWTVCSLMQEKKRKCPGKYIPGQMDGWLTCQVHQWSASPDQERKRRCPLAVVCPVMTILGRGSLHVH
ncbi:hypothetical protein Bbelb_196510 [Branchiostoma belcheri]|nr:hypothetical protein Bbelb_196510 [Branchiostoma belcheri]